ncbi:MAG TPA: hypothetical protein VNY05_03550 [Candidatus Acidoferrales bacterium]|jgi:hypothetical protein|nr:hypothetical protein [Candidatus Acidoferrales bacterium]
MLTQFCIYTIKHSDYLTESQATGGSGVYPEGRAWVTAARLLRDAKLSGERLPVLFSPAEGTRYLFAWALLEEIEITAARTTNYTFTSLKLFEGKQRLKSVLKKRSTGEPLDQNFIRPYAICYTPKFVTDSEDSRVLNAARRRR